MKQKRENFPYILIKSSEPRKFCTAELLLFTVSRYVFHTILDKAVDIEPKVMCALFWDLENL